MNTSPRFLVFFPKQSSFLPAKVGEFVATNQFLGRELYVYQGKTLSVDEFNAMPVHVFERELYPEPVRVNVLMEETTEADLRGTLVAPARSSAAVESPSISACENTNEPPDLLEGEGDDESYDELMKRLIQIEDDKDELARFAESIGFSVDRRYSTGMIREKILQEIEQRELEEEVGA